MKHVRLAVFALALMLTAAACSGDVTGPSASTPVNASTTEGVLP